MNKNAKKAPTTPARAPPLGSHVPGSLITKVCSLNHLTSTIIQRLAHEQLRTHLADFLAAYNFDRRLKTLSGLKPYEYIDIIWTSEPDRFIVNPVHQRPGLNT
ncbi:hypothetical protein FHT02_003404 [Sphingomonas xinjiangensis]|uniref:Integrase catalytic domain-containing protein n=1 Tax=Sphingomonas xinjiangensis TaxID=643568 RepID=A0A840YFB9_9SPHN|nr:hypothetical protein [Sphingomonas xinjiangensis]